MQSGPFLLVTRSNETNRKSLDNRSDIYNYNIATQTFKMVTHRYRLNFFDIKYVFCPYVHTFDVIRCVNKINIKANIGISRTENV